jgi:hypothetical protein
METLNNVNTHKMTRSRTFTLVGLLFLFILGKMVLVSCSSESSRQKEINQEIKTQIQEQEPVESIKDITNFVVNHTRSGADVLIATDFEINNQCEYDTTILDTVLKPLGGGVNGIEEIVQITHLYIETQEDPNFIAKNHQDSIPDLTCEEILDRYENEDVVQYSYKIVIEYRLLDNSISSSSKQKVVKTCNREEIDKK